MTMILYNVTVNIDSNFHLDWTEWMKEVHIPEVMATGCFKDARLSRIQGEEEGGMTFSIMYFAPSQELYDKYLTNFAPRLQEEHARRYQGKFAAFRTVLDVIEVFK